MLFRSVPPSHDDAACTTAPTRSASTPWLDSPLGDRHRHHRCPHTRSLLAIRHRFGGCGQRDIDEVGREDGTSAALSLGGSGLRVGHGARVGVCFEPRLGLRSLKQLVASLAQLSRPFVCLLQVWRRQVPPTLRRLLSC